MTSQQERSQWQPSSLVLQARQHSLDSFVASFESAYLLMVLLDAPASELALGLQALVEGAALDTDPFGFRTVGLPNEEEAAALRIKPSATAGVHVSQPSSTDRLPPELRTKLCHFVPIQKRDKESFLQHVSVGRARNHDIVLRHPSVSKFHAWFELPDGASLQVKDFDSRNRTFIDGTPIERRTVVEPGQTVKFGAVECRVTTPATLWTALRR